VEIKKKAERDEMTGSSELDTGRRSQKEELRSEEKDRQQGQSLVKALCTQLYGGSEGRSE